MIFLIFFESIKVNDPGETGNGRSIINKRTQQILPGKCQKLADNTNVIHRKLFINVVFIY